MSKSLYFGFSSSNAIVIPAERVGRIVENRQANTMTVNVDSASRIGDPQTITLSVASGKGVEAVQDLNDAIKKSADGLIIVADNATGKTISNNITGVSAGLLTIYENA